MDDIALPQIYWHDEEDNLEHDAIELIKEIVYGRGFCRGLEIPARLVGYFKSGRKITARWTANNLLELLDKMVKDGDLVELEYITDESPGNFYPTRVKSLYFPRGTIFNAP